jgi:hypothetical protein
VCDVGDLLVGVLMARDDAAFLEVDASEHGLGAGDELAGKQGVELLGGNVGPTGVNSFRGHHKRVSRVEEKDISGQGRCCRVMASDTDFCRRRGWQKARTLCCGRDVEAAFAPNSMAYERGGPGHG